MTPDLDCLGDATRRRMLALLRIEGEVCVCGLVAALQESQPAVSRKLGALRGAGWLESRREGTWIHYRLAVLPGWALDLVDSLVAGGVPGDVIQAARDRLAAFANGPPHERAA